MLSENTLAEPQESASKPILKRFAINVASLFSVNIANYLLPLLTVPYVVRIIGPERLGLLNFSLSYIAYFTLIINYGFDMAAVRNIAANRMDKVQVNRIFSEVMAGKTLLFVLSTVAFCLITYFNPEFRPHLLLHTCTYISCLGTVLFPIWLYQAMEDLGRVAIFNLIVKVLFTFAVFLLIRQPADYLYQNLAISVAQVLVSAVALIVALRRFKLVFSWPSVDQLVIRFREDSTLFFSSLMITLYANSNVFLLGLFSTAYNVGVFSAGTRLEGIVRSFFGLALNQAFFPIVANAFGQGKEQGLRMVRIAFFPIVTLMIFISIGLWVIAPFFIDLFYGDKFGEAIPVLRIVSLLPITIGISNLLGIHTMLNLRMDKAFFVITAIGSVIGLQLNYLMIQKLGHIGAAYAWIVSEGYITLTMYFYLRYKGVQIIRLADFQESLSFGKAKLSTLFNK